MPDQGALRIRLVEGRHLSKFLRALAGRDVWTCEHHSSLALDRLCRGNAECWFADLPRITGRAGSGEDADSERSAQKRDSSVTVPLRGLREGATNDCARIGRDEFVIPFADAAVLLVSNGSKAVASNAESRGTWLFFEQFGIASWLCRALSDDLMKATKLDE